MTFEIKMKCCLVVAITWIILQSSALAVAPVTFSLDLEHPTKDKYSGLLTNIRNNVKDPKLVYGGTTIPVIGAPTKTYLRIDLISSLGTVSLGLQRSDLYVIAYLAKNEKQKFRACYFDGTITSSQLDTLFPEAKGTKNQQKIREYTEDYKSLEYKAKATRKQAGLGMNKLIQYIAGVNGKARKIQDEAKFLMVAIQMVSEATRSRYIENQILDDFPNAFTPVDKVILAERNWRRISEAIKSSDHGVFPKPVTLDCDYTYVKETWTVNNAAELNVGLLKYLGNALFLSDLSFQANYGGHDRAVY